LGREVRRQAARRSLAGQSKAKGRHVRQVKRSLAQTGLIATSLGAGLRDMTDRIGADIAVDVGILRPAGTDGIEHDEKSARHWFQSSNHENHD
jgi:hypothetical protein